MRLRVGDRAPLIDVQDITGSRVYVPDTKGRQTLVAFVRFAACALCNFRVHALSMRKSSFDRLGLDVVIVTESETELVRATLARGAPYAFVSDSDLVLFKSYALETSIMGTLKSFGRSKEIELGREIMAKHEHEAPREGTWTRMPAEFLVDPSGVLKLAHYARDAGDHPDLDAIEALARGVSVAS